MSLEEQVFLYLTAKGSPKVCAGIPLRLIQYQKLVFCWDKLGLNLLDLKRVSNELIDELWSVHSACERHKNSQTSNSSTVRSVRGGRTATVEKML